MSLVTLNNVHKSFQRGSGPLIHAVNGVSLSIGPKETFALIGESGSGKSTVGRILLHLYRPDRGTVTFDGQDLASLDNRELRALRATLTVVFQEPHESLDPRMTVAQTLEEPLIIHEPGLSRAQRRARVADVLELVALNMDFAPRYPRQLSGGQAQRVGIARAIVTRPRLIVLDEPTSSLDLSVRAQILNLLTDLQHELDLSYLLISHDIHTVEYISNRLAVVYFGQVVETGTTADIFARPTHPYTQALLSSSLSTDPEIQRPQFLLSGEIPSPTHLPKGCYLYGRCPIQAPACAEAPVLLEEIAPAHKVACIKAEQLAP